MYKYEKYKTYMFTFKWENTCTLKYKCNCYFLSVFKTLDFWLIIITLNDAANWWCFWRPSVWPLFSSQFLSNYWTELQLVGRQYAVVHITRKFLSFKFVRVMSPWTCFPEMHYLKIFFNVKVVTPCSHRCPNCQLTYLHH